ncbi:helix-turn-helix domain-containing protein [Rubinisphaera brasiliensis]|uniref:Molybdenum-pterin binding protein n=1 Tax=Rubinisphaera brasiliensis (strain ATCC 49424 / DSM 5305 / JCM 21570 / IAM 15109 / NBRC 103401 / IFAM 1448) TaxID=756272 RepID=F0SSR3_RUBBR|nr:helix-turn-helix domain-containing protein [Rubinisphaera brasiliensis]ADY61391.1 molybdenum-pterin binding protein [Rubinisphaera brasiliensis DSM 5305]
MNLLTSQQAAEVLGISVLTLYDWLGQSDAGEFEIRGERVTIDYYQGGRKGQGRIRIEEAEVRRLLSLMRSTPKPQRRRQSPTKTSNSFRHITTKLGRPDD